MMKRDRYIHIRHYLHFTDNRNEPDRADESFDRLWKIRDLFEILNATFSKFYNPSKNLAIDKVIVPFKGRVIFRQYIPKKRKCFGIKIFKLCDATGYTYDMKVYLGKDRQRMVQHLTATHATVTELTRKIEGRGHKLYMDNFFSSPELFDDLAKKQIGSLTLFVILKILNDQKQTFVVEVHLNIMRKVGRQKNSRQMAERILRQKNAGFYLFWGVTLWSSVNSG